MMKKYILLIILLINIKYSYGQDELALGAPVVYIQSTLQKQRLDSVIKYARNYKPENKYGALILINYLKDEIKKEGICKTNNVAIKVISENGKDLSVPKIIYDASRQKVNILSCRIIQEDGRIIDFSESKYEYNYYMRESYFSNIKQIILNPPDLRVGSIVNYEYQIIDRYPIMEKNYWSGWLPVSLIPTIETSYCLVAPNDIEFFIWQKATNMSYIVKGDDGWNAFVWVKNFVEPLAVEPNMTLNREEMGWVGLSTVKNWSELANWYYELYKVNLQDDLVLTFTAKGITKDCQDDYARVKKIYEWVNREIRYVALLFGSGAYEPRRPRIVMETRYGDCKDKSILMIALLKQLNIKAYPVLIRPSAMGPIIEDIASLSEFNHMIVAVEQNGNLIWADPTSNFLPLGQLPSAYSNVKGMIIKEGKPEFLVTPMISIEKYGKQRKGNIKYDKNQWYFNVTTRYDYENAAYRRFICANYTENEQKKDWQEYILGISPFAMLDSFKVLDLDSLEKPLGVVLNFRVESDTEKSVNSIKVSPILLDIAQIKSDVENIYSYPTRKYPMIVEAAKYKSDIDIFVPEKYEIKLIPTNIEMKNDFSWVSVRYINHLTKITLKINVGNISDVIPVEKYTEQQKFWKTALYRMNDNIVFQKKKK